MLSPASMTLLETLAFEAIQHVFKERSKFAIETPTPFECKAWRSNGFSDSAIYQLTCEFGSYSIRSWPNRFDTSSKIGFWSHVNDLFFQLGDHGLRSGGAVSAKPFPTLYQWHPPGRSATPLLAFDNQLWTLCDWVSGQPIKRDIVDKALVIHLATILGKLHFHSGKAFDGIGSMQSNSIRERFEALKRVDYSLFQLIEQSPFFSVNNLADRVKHCLAIVMERATDWQRFLSISANQMRNCHWIVRDLWRENILVDETHHFSSIVDLGASRMDWPGLDFSRFFGSLSYGPCPNPLLNHDGARDVWQDAYQAYTSANPTHDIGFLEECRMLSLVSNGLSIAQWVQWIHAGTMDLSVPEKARRVSERVAELCDSLLIAAS